MVLEQKQFRSSNHGFAAQRPRSEVVQTVKSFKPSIGPRIVLNDLNGLNFLNAGLQSGLPLLLTQKFFHPLDDVAWLRNGLLGQGFELLAVIRIGLKLSCFDFGEKRRIAHGFAECLAENF